MGAVPFDDGVGFRVWAPNAHSVAVAGDFNGWSRDADPLTHEGNGYWACFAGSARIGHRYKFVIDGTLWRNDPYARSIEREESNSVIADPAFAWQVADFSPPPQDELVIYELHIGTFNAELGPGSFDTAIDRLDHVRDLGCNAVEIMAAGEFPFDVSWGYNPAYIFAIESSLGGPNAFRRFVDAAHARGLAVIFDVVYNHFANDHLDLWQFDGWRLNEHHGGIYFYDGERSVTPWGNNRPDYGRPEVRQYFRDNALRWIETRAVDGLRWDATNYIRNIDGNNNAARDIPDGWRMMQWINDEIEARSPAKVSIAEDMQGNEWVTRETSAGGAGFDAQWDARFMHAVRDARGVRAIADVLCAPYPRVVYTESHDEGRLPQDRGRDAQKRSTLAASIVFTSPGIPMIFQGQEFLATEPFRAEDALRWSNAHHGIENLYRDLIGLRRGLPGLRGPNVNVFHVNDDAQVLAYQRDETIVLANFSNRAFDAYRIWFPRDGVWHVRFNGDWGGYSDAFGNHPSNDVFVPGNSGEVSIGAMTAVVLTQ